VTVTARKWVLLLVVALAALNVATVAAWISIGSGSAVPMAIRDGGVAFGGTMTLGTVLLYSFGVLS
jgi:hypothetical protein